MTFVSEGIISTLRAFGFCAETDAPSSTATAGVVIVTVCDVTASSVRLAVTDGGL